MDDNRGRDPSVSASRRVSPQRLLVSLMIGAALTGLTVISSLEWAPAPPEARAYPHRSLPPEPEQRILAAPEPDDDYFPCSDCHEDEPTNRRVRKLEDDHEDLVLDHGELWCLHCHDAKNRNRLHLADGKKIAFEDSWRLCVQCHGTKQESWRAGVHGKRVGHWWGARDVWTCVSCHQPHAPHFQPIEPKPPPARPSQITFRTSREEDVRE